MLFWYSGYRFLQDFVESYKMAKTFLTKKKKKKLINKKKTNKKTTTTKQLFYTKLFSWFGYGLLSSDFDYSSLLGQINSYFTVSWPTIFRSLDSFDPKSKIKCTFGIIRR